MTISSAAAYTIADPMFFFNLTRSLLLSPIGDEANQLWLHPSPIGDTWHCRLNNDSVRPAPVQGGRDLYSV